MTSLPLEGKIILVTGGTRGIGRAISKAVHRDGATVIAHYGSGVESAQVLRDELQSNIFILKSDFSEPEGAGSLWQQAVSQCGHIDVLINNAGVYAASKIEDETQWQEGWSLNLQVNLSAAADLCRHAILHFRESGGIIINMASRSSHCGDDADHLAYGAAKGGLLALTKGISRSYAHQGILAYALAPGWVRTEMADAFIAEHGEEAVCADLPMREITPPEEIAEMAAFLASGRVRHATGCTIDITGADYVR